MGLFSFLKKAGSNVFGGGEKAEEIANNQKKELLTGVLDGLNLEVDDLNLDVDGDKVSISGKVEDQPTKEKVILAIGNTAGVSTVEDNLEVINPAPAEAEAQFYEVKSGDSLSKIAKEVYGDPMKYPMIFEANKPMLTDPNLIYPGQVLRIPAL